VPKPRIIKRRPLGVGLSVRINPYRRSVLYG
jgi:hypothetical protein